MKSYSRLALFLLILLLSVGLLSTAINILGDITELDLEEEVPGLGAGDIGPAGLSRGTGEAVAVEDPNAGNIGPIFEIQYPPQTKYLRRMVAENYRDGFWYTVDEGEYVDYYTGVELDEVREPKVETQNGRMVIFKIRPLEGNKINNWAPIPKNVEILNINNTLHYYPKLDLFAINNPINQSYEVFYKKYDFTNFTLKNGDLYDYPPALQYPEHFTPRIEELAIEVTRGKSTPYERYKAIEMYLEENYEYDEEFDNAPPGTDPVEWFLFDHPKGIASHFNTAFVMMARSIGLPARAVMGFIVDADDEYQLVFPQNAHLYAEAPFQDMGWLTFDANPQRTEERPGNMEMLPTVTNITGNDPVAIKGKIFHVWGYVTLENGTGADGAQVEILLKVNKTDEAGIQVGLGMTEADGYYNISCEALTQLQVGDYQLIAHTLPSGLYDESWSDPPIRIVDEIAVEVDKPDKVFRGKRVGFGATLIENSTGVPVVNKEVEITLDGRRENLTTDNRGRLYFRHKFNEEGKKNVTINVPDSDYYIGTNTTFGVAVAIQPTNFLTLITTFPYSVILVSGIAGIIGVGVVLTMKKPDEEMITVQLKPPLVEEGDDNSPITFRTYEEGVVKLFNRFYRKAQRVYPEVDNSLTPREFETYLLTKIPPGSEFALDDVITSFEIAEYGNMKLTKEDFDRCEATIELIVELMMSEEGYEEQST
jgi:transglutaminase-like putative cysteine protease